MRVIKFMVVMFVCAFLYSSSASARRDRGSHGTTPLTCLVSPSTPHKANHAGEHVVVRVVCWGSSPIIKVRAECDGECEIEDADNNGAFKKSYRKHTKRILETINVFLAKGRQSGKGRLRVKVENDNGVEEFKNLVIDWSSAPSAVERPSQRDLLEVYTQTGVSRGPEP